MGNFVFDDGVITLEVNGDPSHIFSFNPTDDSIYEGFYKMIADVPEKLKGAQEREEKLIKNKENMTSEEYLEETFSIRNETDAVLRESFDNIFGSGASDIVFEEKSLMALGTNGDYIIVNALMAIVPFFEKETKKRKNKIKKIIEENKPKRG